MDWLALSLAAALCSSGEAAAMKKLLDDRTPEEMGLTPLVFALPLCLAVLALARPPLPPAGFWLDTALLMPFSFAGYVLYCQAIRLSPLSLTLPYLSLVPVFTMLTGRLALGEIPSPAGGAGVLLLAAGSYVLNLRERAAHGVWGPLLAVFREPGPRRILAVAALYSVVAVIGKRAAVSATPLGYLAWLPPVYVACFVLLLSALGRVRLGNILARPGRGAALGLIHFVHLASGTWAVVMTQTAYMLAVKRMDGLFGVLLGRAAFREQDIPARLAGTGLMLAGAAVIAVWGRG
ncbi:MAG: DMT family transporter [Thermodesulfobacteriota bacterium]